VQSGAALGNAAVVTAETERTPRDVQLRHVLVPLDGSEFALQAMPTARVLAERFGAELQTISVVRADQDAARLRALASAELDVELGDEAQVVSSSDPVDIIAGRAEELDPCLVCLTTHGRGRFSGAAIGSVARSVLQRSIAPMVALGPEADNPGWSPRPRGWPEPLSVPRIVACVDGSDSSEQVLPLAAAWAGALGMSLTILTVIADELSPIRGEPDQRYGSEGDAQSYIDSLVHQWHDRLAHVDGEVARDPISPAAVRGAPGRRPASSRS
jgi:nucleotide-binding universal stress UspA family protein